MTPHSEQDETRADRVRFVRVQRVIEELLRDGLRFHQAAELAHRVISAMRYERGQKGGLQ